MSPDERFDNDCSSWQLPQNHHGGNHDNNITEYGQELISKGPPKAEVQLRYVVYKNVFLFTEKVWVCGDFFRMVLGGI